MIIDLKKFIQEEQPYWDELEAILKRISDDPLARTGIEQTKRFFYLYQRACAGLSRISGCSTEADMRRYLESLVARSYAEVHETRKTGSLGSLGKWFIKTFPRTFRRHIIAFLISLSVMLTGAIAGGFFVSKDTEAKQIILPFEHLEQTPRERVAEEEKAVSDKDRLAGKKTSFSAMLMTHNIRVSILTFALGLTYGIGTIIMLFYNGIILGAICFDYTSAGQMAFLVGWLLPHGAIEIPSVLIAGQAGILLAWALIGWGSKLSLRARLRKISGDIVTLVSGLAILLVWAGIIEAFLSQYHEPVLPYWLKITFGMAELIVLVLFLLLSGRDKQALEEG